MSALAAVYLPIWSVPAAFLACLFAYLAAEDARARRRRRRRRERLRALRRIGS